MRQDRRFVQYLYKSDPLALRPTEQGTSGLLAVFTNDLRVYYAPFGAHSFALPVFLLKCARTA